jgi:kynurenine formamidase
MDDMYNRFYPQASSQWDALCHVAHPEYGFYNNRRAEEFTGKEGTKNGIEHWARKGIVGRGILFDCERYFTDIGRDYDPAKTIDISVDDLEGMRESVGIEYEEGDILLLRTGWMSWYDNSSLETRRTIAEDSLNLVKSPGLAGGDDMAEYLWDSRFAAVASDTSALEAWPHPWEVGKYLHFSALALLGMPIGEMWFLDELAKDCATDGSWTFLLVSAPLNKLGGVGSPPNAIAIK